VPKKVRDRERSFVTLFAHTMPAAIPAARRPKRKLEEACATCGHYHDVSLKEREREGERERKRRGKH